MITIISKINGFRRCSVAHSAKPTDYDDDFFTHEQLKQLHDDDMLVVICHDESAEAGKAEKKAKA
jgi:triosephosphate isomerase